MVEVKGFYFKLRVSRSFLSPTTMSGINVGDEVSNSLARPLAPCQGTENSRQKLVFESSEAVSVVSTFDDLNLKEDLLRGIYAYS